MNSSSTQAMGEIISLYFDKNGFGIRLPIKVDMQLNKKPNHIRPLVFKLRTRGPRGQPRGQPRGPRGQP